MDDTQKKLKSILKMADPQANSSYQERKVALDKAHKIMDDTGMSYASVGMSQSDAERIETQFSVSASTTPKKERQRSPLSIFQRSDAVQSYIPPRTRQPAPSQPKKVIPSGPSWEEENERKQREDFDRRYKSWEEWRTAEDAIIAENERLGAKALKVFVAVVAFLILAAILIISSQNEMIINAVVLVAKIFGGIIFSLLALFGLFYLR